MKQKQKKGYKYRPKDNIHVIDWERVNRAMDALAALCIEHPELVDHSAPAWDAESVKRMVT